MGKDVKRIPLEYLVPILNTGMAAWNELVDKPFDQIITMYDVMITRSECEIKEAKKYRDHLYECRQEIQEIKRSVSKLDAEIKKRDGNNAGNYS